jgi:hypothetical protein
VTEPKWEAEELEDGRVRVRIDVEGMEPFYLKELIGNQRARMHVLQVAVEHQMLRRRLFELHGALERADATMERSATSETAPPFLAEVMISLLAPKNTVQSLLGDLQEMFQKNANRLGERRARRKYWLQVSSSIRPLLFHWLKRIGFFTVLIDYFRSKFGV